MNEQGQTLADKMEAGVRVVRGPDWEWGDQDGGEGHVGTVVEVEEARNGGRPVIVQWDCGQRCRYRCGVQGKYDLRVIDSAPTGLKHHNTSCTWCDAEPIAGVLWKCGWCHDYFLCTQCYMANKHSVDHPFDRCDDAKDLKKRTRLQPRYNGRRRAVKGIFSGAIVERGADWNWGDQDGGTGNRGRVVKVEGWRDETARSVADVMWNGMQSKNVYRVGHHGKVDLRCTAAGDGGFYYPDHLPVLGAPFIPPEVPVLSAGDACRVELDPDLFKIAQEEHGGWHDRMAEYIGRVGVVNSIHDNGDVVVRYSNNKIFLLNKDTLTKVDIPVFGYGDAVRIIEDMPTLHSLQEGHGGWNDDMALCLGQVGRVIRVQANSNVTVAVNGRRWTMNPRSLIAAPNEPVLEEKSDQIYIRMSVKMNILAMSHANSPDVVVVAAQEGDVETLVDCLRKNPHLVNYKADGKCALHSAIVEGFTAMVKAILEFEPDLEVKDDTGKRPLHLCAYMNNFEAADLLVEASADVNSKDSSGNTPVALAAALGHHKVLEVLIASLRVNVNESDQESDGKTPLHDAVFSQQRKSVRMLLENGADPTLCDLSLFTALHNTAGFGFLAGLEEFLRYYPEHVKLQKDDGYTPLHVAAVNDHCDLVSFLASHPQCDVNTRCKTKLTPLHIAIHEGHVRVVERLVGFGADLNMPTHDGNTSLHLALGRNTMSNPDERTPFIKKLMDEVETTYGKNTLPVNVIVGIFLVTQGADVFTKNVNGVSPLQIRAADVSSVIKSYRGTGEARDSFRGSLRQLVQPFTEPPRQICRRPRGIQTAPISTAAATAAALPLPLSRIQLEPPRSATTGHTLVIDSHVPSRKAIPVSSDVPPPSTLDSLEIRRIKMQANMVNNQSDTTIVSPQATVPVYGDLKSCDLCESSADIKLLPCGDVSLCHKCLNSVKDVKKCPQCRATVSSHVPVCVLCYRVENLTTKSPCGHTYCPNCGSRHCIACQIQSEKENT